MTSREDQSGSKLQVNRTKGKLKLSRIMGTAHQDGGRRMERFWAVCLTALIGHTPAYGASGQAGFVCRETATTITSESTTPVYQVRADATIVFDFDRRLVFHGDGSERHPIHKITDRVITWRSEDGDLKGFFNRSTLEVGEFYRGPGSLTHRAYACRLTSYLSFDPKP